MNAGTKLPSRLGKSPLVEALFEIRFQASMPVSSILTGFLYTQLGCTEIQKTPHAEIPEQFRLADPNLFYAPLTRLIWGDCAINLGDRNIILSHSFPYSGWRQFSARIKQVLDIALQINIITFAERFSLKYTDIFSMPGFNANGEGFNFHFNFNPLSPNNLATHARIEVPDGEKHHIIQYFGDALANLPNGVSMQGVMLDVDTIQGLSQMPFIEFMSRFEELSSSLHESNKTTFFKMLSEAGVAALEPTYE